MVLSRKCYFKAQDLKANDVTIEDAEEEVLPPEDDASTTTTVVDEDNDSEDEKGADFHKIR